MTTYYGIFVQTAISRSIAYAPCSGSHTCPANLLGLGLSARCATPSSSISSLMRTAAESHARAIRLKRSRGHFKRTNVNISHRSSCIFSSLADNTMLRCVSAENYKSGHFLFLFEIIRIYTILERSFESHISSV